MEDELFPDDVLPVLPVQVLRQALPVQMLVGFEEVLGEDVVRGNGELEPARGVLIRLVHVFPLPLKQI